WGGINVSKDIVTWNHLGDVIIYNQPIDYEKKNKKAYDFLTNRGENKYTNIDFLKEIQKYFSYLLENKIKNKNNDEYEIQNPITRLNQLFYPYQINRILHSKYINDRKKFQLMCIAYYFGSEEKQNGVKVLIKKDYDEVMKGKEITLDIVENVNKVSYSKLDYINEMQNYYEYVLRVYKEGLKHDSIEIIKQELKLLKEEVNLIKNSYEKEVKQEFDSFKKLIEEQKKIDTLVTKICIRITVHEPRDVSTTKKTTQGICKDYPFGKTIRFYVYDGKEADFSITDFPIELRNQLQITEDYITNKINELQEKIDNLNLLKQEFDLIKEQEKINILVREICTMLSINLDDDLLKIHHALLPNNNIDNVTDQKEIIKSICD
ncbi:3280_t:CDS:2, partial [Dentiscutata erythropus]